MAKERFLGNKENFAIQYEVTSVLNQFIYGRLCYWIEGRQIGKYEEIILSDILLFLPTIIKDSGNRRHEKFFVMEKQTVFHLLSGAAFLDDNEEIERRANEEKWARFNISIPIGALGDVFMFLIDSNEKSRLIFTDNEVRCLETYIESGYIDKLFLQLYSELDSIYSKMCC